jgi:hypothetical protein
MKRRKFQRPPVVEVRHRRGVTAPAATRRALPDNRIKVWHDDQLQREAGQFDRLFVKDARSGSK